MLLLGANVHTLADRRQTEHIAVEGEARVRGADADRRMVDTEKQPTAGVLPAAIAFSGWEVNQLDRTPGTPHRRSYSGPDTSTSLTFSKSSTLVKNAVERTTSVTVMPITVTART